LTLQFTSLDAAGAMAPASVVCAAPPTVIAPDGGGMILIEKRVVLKTRHIV